MKILATNNFIESLMKIGNFSFSNLYWKIKNWFKYHFNKDCFNIFKCVLNGYPWDYDFLYDIEYAKIKEMMNFHQKHKRHGNWEYVVRDMKLCLNLMDIFREKIELFHFDGDILFKPIKENNDEYELTKTDDFKYHCDVNVNLKNIKRFVKNKKLYEFYIRNPHELYILKAKYLYHMIRYEHDGEWWD